MWPGHPARHRVDRVVDLDAPVAQHVDQLAQRVLRLGDGQPVAGHDDHPVGVAQQDRDVLGPGRADRPVGGHAGAQGGAALQRPEQDVGHRAAHRRGHQLGQERAAGPDQGAGDQQHGVAQDVAAGRDGQAGEGVEQRDDDGHVGPADRQHQQAARAAARPPRAPRRPTPRAGSRSARPAPARRRSERPKATGRPGKTTGREVISSCSLAKVTSEPGERHRADQDRERGRGQGEPLRQHAVHGVGQLEQRHEGGGPATDPVEQRHQLRHLRHLHAPGPDQPDRRTDRDGDQDRHDVVEVGVEEHHHAGDDRADGADQVARRGRCGARTGPSAPG